MAKDTIATIDTEWEAVTTAERFARSAMDQYKTEIIRPLYAGYESLTRN